MNSNVKNILLCCCINKLVPVFLIWSEFNILDVLFLYITKIAGFDSAWSHVTNIFKQIKLQADQSQFMTVLRGTYMRFSLDEISANVVRNALSCILPYLSYYIRALFIALSTQDYCYLVPLPAKVQFSDKTKTLPNEKSQIKFFFI